MIEQALTGFIAAPATRFRDLVDDVVETVAEHHDRVLPLLHQCQRESERLGRPVPKLELLLAAVERYTQAVEGGPA